MYELAAPLCCNCPSRRSSPPRAEPRCCRWPPWPQYVRRPRMRCPPRAPSGGRLGTAQSSDACCRHTANSETVTGTAVPVKQLKWQLLAGHSIRFPFASSAASRYVILASNADLPLACMPPAHCHPASSMNTLILNAAYPWPWRCAVCKGHVAPDAELVPAWHHGQLLP